MDLFVGPKENRMVKNVAARMFCAVLTILMHQT